MRSHGYGRLLIPVPSSIYSGRLRSLCAFSWHRGGRLPGSVLETLPSRRLYPGPMRWGDIGAISSHMQTLLHGPFPQGKVPGLSSVLLRC